MKKLILIGLLLCMTGGPAWAMDEDETTDTETDGCVGCAPDPTPYFDDTVCLSEATWVFECWGLGIFPPTTPTAPTDISLCVHPETWDMSCWSQGYIPTFPPVQPDGGYGLPGAGEYRCYRWESVADCIARGIEP